VEALVLGEHGVSSVLLWSAARVGGRKVLDLFAQTSAAPDKAREELEKNDAVHVQTPPLDALPHQNDSRRFS